MLNKVIIMGRMTKDPELKYTPSRVPVTSFSIAVNRSYKNPDGNYASDFLDCVAWRGTAEFITRYFQKGSLCAIEGTLQTRSWEDKNKNKRKAVEIIVENIYFAGEKKNGGENDVSEYDSDAFDFPEEDEFIELGDDEEIPF